MGWLFGQVWILCAVAFLLGAAVTWVVFVRPRAGGDVAGGRTWTPLPAWATGAVDAVVPAAAPPVPAAVRAGPAVNPALAALDARSGDPLGSDAPRTGASVAGALDLLGVPLEVTDPEATPVEGIPIQGAPTQGAPTQGAAVQGIPAQAGPVDAPNPGGRA